MTALLDQLVASVVTLARKSALDAVAGIFAGPDGAAPQRNAGGRRAADDQGTPRSSGRITDVAELAPLIVDRLAASDGLTVIEIARAVLQSPEVVKRVLKKLVAGGQARHEGNTRARRYFAGGSASQRESPRARRRARKAKGAARPRKGAAPRSRKAAPAKAKGRTRRAAKRQRRGK